ncbi:MAG: deoxyribonuclease IV [Mollicutes bacterium]|jgi:deoxyribonuclease-4|nr:deoxyribonuclease IV [Mollicutes bacterium]
MLIIGSHVSFSSNNQLLGSVKEALSYGANTFMIYTGAPQNTLRSPINEELTKEAIELMKESGILMDLIICHAPYIVNLANHVGSDKHEFSVQFLTEEVRRCSLLGIKYLVLHPGSSVNMTKEEGLNNVVSGLNKILDNNYDVMILLESMAGKGNEVGSNLSELKYLYDNVKYQNKLGFCLDTCHLNDSGHDITSFDQYLDLFDQEIGLDKIKCLHVNDSKNEIGDRKDRHDNFGFGTIGFDNLISAVYNEKIKNIPKILETPYIGEDDEDKLRIYPPYKFEIEMIKEKEFDPNLKEKIRNYYRKS